MNKLIAHASQTAAALSLLGSEVEIEGTQTPDSCDWLNKSFTIGCIGPLPSEGKGHTFESRQALFSTRGDNLTTRYRASQIFQLTGLTPAVFTFSGISLGQERPSAFWADSGPC